MKLLPRKAFNSCRSPLTTAVIIYRRKRGFLRGHEWLVIAQPLALHTRALRSGTETLHEEITVALRAWPERHRADLIPCVRETIMILLGRHKTVQGDPPMLAHRSQPLPLISAEMADSCLRI